MGQPSTRVALLWVGLAAFFLALFLLLEPLLPRALADPSTWLDDPNLLVAAAAVLLLASDVVLPIPSSLVMIADGAAFGVVLGTVLSTVGATASALIGYVIGRGAGDRTRDWLGPEATLRLQDLLSRHGLAVVVLTRPIPILAEVTALMAGSGRMPARGFLVASIVGAAVTSLVYAAAGAGAAAGKAGWLAFGGALAMAAGFWLVGQRATRRRTAVPARPDPAPFGDR